MGLKLGNYFLLTRPETPTSEVDGLIFDTNFISAVYKWFTSSGKDIEAPPGLVEILMILREKKMVHWQYGALENAWKWQNVHEVTSENFDKVNPHLFNQIGLCIHTILLASEEDFLQWILPSRDFSIPFMDRGKIPYFDEKLDHQSASELTEVVNSVWIQILLLMKEIQDIQGSKDVQKLKFHYERWVKTYRGLGLPRYSDVELLAYMGIFGGTLENAFYRNSHSSKREVGRAQSAAELLKVEDWNRKGRAKIARNIAFDLLMFRYQHMQLSGLKQVDYEFVNVRPEKMAIATGDNGMNALSGALRKYHPIRGQLFPAEYRYPRDSIFVENYPQLSDMSYFWDLRYTKPEYLPTLSELRNLLKSLIDDLA